jgi:NAD(P)-dependent dehydrogenase (short-subunit alcohol dehydrogenase family)
MSSSVRYDFQNTVTVVTGGSQGIGAEVVRLMRTFGSQAVVWDLQAPSTEPEIFCAVDVTDRAAVERATQDTLHRWGRIDHVVNCAGWAGPTMPLAQFDPAVWDKVIAINLVGVYNVCRAVVPGMQQQGAGRIVNIASLAGKEGTPNASAYSAAKGGVLALTKSLGKELATSGVLVNAIAPAAIDTPMLSQMSAAHVQTMVDKSPMKRLGSVREVADLVAWLCSDACNFSTGAVFDLSGGRATY